MTVKKRLLSVEPESVAVQSSYCRHRHPPRSVAELSTTGSNCKGPNEFLLICSTVVLQSNSIHHTATQLIIRKKTKKRISMEIVSLNRCKAHWRRTEEKKKEKEKKSKKRWRRMEPKHKVPSESETRSLFTTLLLKDLTCKGKSYSTMLICPPPEKKKRAASIRDMQIQALTARKKKRERHATSST